MVYTLFWHQGEYSDKVVYLCGTFSSEELARSYRQTMLDDPKIDAQVQDFVLLSTPLDQGVQMLTEYNKEDLFEQEKVQLRRQSYELHQKQRLEEMKRIENRRSMFDTILFKSSSPKSK